MTTSPAISADVSPAPEGRRELPVLELDRRAGSALGKAEAESYAEWFAVLADPTRVRLLHTLSTSRTTTRALAERGTQSERMVCTLGEPVARRTGNGRKPSR